MIRDQAYFKSITEEIIGCAFAVSNTLGAGFVEKVYENALRHELGKTDLLVQQQFPIRVQYDEIVVGDFVADLLIQDEIIVELKAVKALDKSHFAQCMNYLKATDKRVALLINFGAPRIEVKRIVNSQAKAL